MRLPACHCCFFVTLKPSLCGRVKCVKYSRTSSSLSEKVWIMGALMVIFSLQPKQRRKTTGRPNGNNLICWKLMRRKVIACLLLLHFFLNTFMDKLFVCVIVSVAFFFLFKRPKSFPLKCILCNVNSCRHTSSP